MNQPIKAYLLWRSRLGPEIRCTKTDRGSGPKYPVTCSNMSSPTFHCTLPLGFLSAMQKVPRSSIQDLLDSTETLKQIVDCILKCSTHLLRKFGYSRLPLLARYHCKIRRRWDRRKKRICRFDSCASHHYEDPNAPKFDDNSTTLSSRGLRSSAVSSKTIQTFLLGMVVHSLLTPQIRYPQ